MQPSRESVFTLTAANLRRPNFMIPRKCLALALALAALVGSALTSGAQTTVTTDPVGFTTIVCSGSSDTYVNLSLTNAPQFVGTVASVSGSQIVLSGTPGWTANQWVYVAGSQTSTYYALITGTGSGASARAGVSYTVVSSDTNSVTVNAGGDALAANVTAGTSLSIIAYATLNTLFPGGQGINGSPSFSLFSRQTDILIPDTTTAGVNLSAAADYYYYTGSSGWGPGWRRQGASTSSTQNDIPISPDTYIIVRNNTSLSSTITLVGNVPMTRLNTFIGTRAVGTAQDNQIGLLLSATTTLAGSNLYQSGAFVGSSSFSLANRMDQLLVFDNTVTGFNQAATYGYFYYTGASSGGPGWRKAGANSIIADGDQIFGNPQYGVILRKAVTSGTTPIQSVVWPLVPSYVP